MNKGFIFDRKAKKEKACVNPQSSDPITHD